MCCTVDVVSLSLAGPAVVVIEVTGTNYPAVLSLIHEQLRHTSNRAEPPASRRGGEKGLVTAQENLGH